MDGTNKGFVTIDDYVKYVSDTPSIKKIAVSLFNFFDKKGYGVITFWEILKGMIPEATEDQVKKMLKWVQKINIIYGYSEEEEKWRVE